MKLRKVLTGSVLSLGLLVSAAPAFASTPDTLTTTNNNFSTSIFKPSKLKTVGYWDTSLSANAKKDLDTITFGSGSAYSIDGYQTAGSFGTPNITYRLYEKLGGKERSYVTGQSKSVNGYFYITFSKSDINPDKEYYLEAENNSNFKVDLKGNAYRS